VDFETNLQQRFDVQRLHHSAVFSQSGTGLSSHEVNQPGSYRDVTDTTVVAQFKAIEATLPSAFKGFGAVDILAWTTTPWTLPSNTALTVGPKIDYVLVKTFNQYTFFKCSFG
jgi:isoleucyl-tRNA synthetase